MQERILKRFWAVCRECGISNEDAHARVLAEFGTEHISTLRDSEALYIIDGFLGKRPMKPRTHGAMASDKQIWLIQKLAAELGWNDNPDRLSGFVRKYAGVDNLLWLTKKQASAVIEGLKRLTERSSPHGF